MPRKRQLRQALLPGVVEHEGKLVWLPPGEAPGVCAPPEAPNVVKPDGTRHALPEPLGSADRPPPEAIGPLRGEPIAALGVSAADLDAAYVGAAWQPTKVKGGKLLKLPVTVAPVTVNGRPYVCVELFEPAAREFDALRADLAEARRAAGPTEAEIDLLLERWDQTASWLQRQIVVALADRTATAEGEVVRLRGLVESMAARVAGQSELLSRRAEEGP